MSDRVLEEIAALKDEDWALREEAATLLGEFRDPRAVGPLVEALHDEDRAVREAATTALRKIGPPAAPALIVALQDPNGNVQEAAVAILKDVATPEAVEPLIGCLTSKNWIVRMHAAKALGNLGDERPVRQLIPLLMDSVKAGRGGATDALAQIGGPALATLLATARPTRAGFPSAGTSPAHWTWKRWKCRSLPSAGLPRSGTIVRSSPSSAPSRTPGSAPPLPRP